MPVSRMVPPKVRRSTIAAQSLGSVKVLVQPPKDYGCDGDGCLLLAFGVDLEEEFGTTPVQLHVAEFIVAQQSLQRPVSTTRHAWAALAATGSPSVALTRRSDLPIGP